MAVAAVSALAAVAASMATAAPAGRSPNAVKPLVFADATGDAPGAAPDLTQVKVSNDDAGVVTIEVDVRDPRWVTVGGNMVWVLLDADRNRYSGDSKGEDLILAVT